MVPQLLARQPLAAPAPSIVALGAERVRDEVAA
jgi:hypothetical protein